MQFPLVDETVVVYVNVVGLVAVIVVGFHAQVVSTVVDESKLVLRPVIWNEISEPGATTEGDIEEIAGAAGRTVKPLFRLTTSAEVVTLTLFTPVGAVSATVAIAVKVF